MFNAVMEKSSKGNRVQIANCCILKNGPRAINALIGTAGNPIVWHLKMNLFLLVSRCNTTYLWSCSVLKRDEKLLLSHYPWARWMSSALTQNSINASETFCFQAVFLSGAGNLLFQSCRIKQLEYGVLNTTV